MKFIIGLLIFSSQLALSQSLYDQRSQAAEAASKEHWHELYTVRSQELIARLQEKLQRMAAAHGGITNFSFSCSPGSCVSGSTFLGYGSFDTADGALGCRIPVTGLDFVSCKGPELTRCPDLGVVTDCLDASGKRVYLQNIGSRRTGGTSSRH